MEELDLFFTGTDVGVTGLTRALPLNLDVLANRSRLTFDTVFKVLNYFLMFFYLFKR